MSFTTNNLQPLDLSRKRKSELYEGPKKKWIKRWRQEQELEEISQGGTAPDISDAEAKLVTTKRKSKYTLNHIDLKKKKS